MKHGSFPRLGLRKNQVLPTLHAQVNVFFLCILFTKFQLIVLDEESNTCINLGSESQVAENLFQHGVNVKVTYWLI